MTRHIPIDYRVKTHRTAVAETSPGPLSVNDFYPPHKTVFQANLDPVGMGG